MKTRTFPALAATVLLAAPAVAGDTLDEALAAFRAGEYTRTLELAHSVPTGGEDHPRALFVAGETELLLGDAKAAEASFRGVLAERPEAVPALVGLGRALAMAGRFEPAREALERALAAEPADLAARRSMGELLTATGDLPKARELLLGVFEAEPRDPRSARALVGLLLRMEVAPDAMRVAEDFTVARPKHPMGWFLTGVVQETLGEDEAAIRSYRAALERDERFLDAHKNLGILCHTLSDTYQIVERNRIAMRHYALYFELGGKDPRLAQTFEQMKAFLTPEGEIRTPAPQTRGG